MRKSLQIATSILLQVLLCLIVRAEVKFEIAFDRAVQAEPLTGRVILVIARSDRPEPRLQVGPNTTPIFGVDAENLSPGQTVVLDQTTFGHPIDNLSQLPVGDYYVAVYLFEDFAKKATNPPSDATFEYGRPMKGHSWHAKNFADMLREMAEQVKKNTPPGESSAWAEY